MNIEDYREFCLSLGDGIEERFPFAKFKNGEGVLVFYICGHMFSYFDCDDFQVISLKCQPERKWLRTNSLRTLPETHTK